MHDGQQMRALMMLMMLIMMMMVMMVIPNMHAWLLMFVLSGLPFFFRSP